MSEERDEPASSAFDRAQFGAETPRWKRLRAEQVADCRVFKVRHDLCASPRDASEHDFYCIEAPDWINIIPLTARDEVLMIEQYRHGSNEVTLEIPGGMVDEDETPEDAARRELLEETGYTAREVLFLGKTRPNPAIQNNWIHTYLARDAAFDHTPVFESTEHTVVRIVPLADVPALIGDGTINHALVVVGFHLLSLYKERLNLNYPD